MEYEIFLKHDVMDELNINDYAYTPCNHVFADIIYKPIELVVKKDEGEEADDPGTKIGRINWVYYNQALARAYGVNMSKFTYFSLIMNRDALKELDYTNITPETIAAIGPATNPNIMLLLNFRIAAEWRNKGIGERTLKGIVKQAKGKCGYIVIINCEPHQFRSGNNPADQDEEEANDFVGLETDPEKAQWKLNAFVQRCGFKQFKNYNDVFICNVDQTMASIKMVPPPAIKFV